MLFAIDIDGTIAQDEHGRAYARFLNRALDPGVAEEVIVTLPDLPTFLGLPEMYAFAQGREKHRQQYLTAVRAARYDPDVQRSLIPISGAVEGVNALAQHGQIVYVTCRQPESRLLTREWLAHYRFPQPEQVFFCDSYYEKCISVHEADRRAQPVVMIDDHALDVIRGFKRLSQERPDVAISLLKRFAFLLFGASSVPDFPRKNKFRVAAAPSWEAIVADLTQSGTPVLA